MCRSYFFALLACFIFSAAALSNAYHNLPAPEVSQTLPAAFDTDRSVEKSETISSIPENAGTPPETRSVDTPGMPMETGDSGEAFLYEAPSGKLPAGQPRKSPDLAAVPFSAGDFAQPNIIPLNHQTDNFNILMLGVDKDKLEMVSVYSINHRLETEQPKSVSLFFPTNSLFIYKGKKKTLEGIFAAEGWEAITGVMEKEMFIDIDYYVKIDRQALRDLEKYFDPIYVDGEKVDMENLFVRRTSNQDDRIIALVLRQVLRPEVFFRYIPRLVFSSHRDIESNFSFTPQNLVFYYRLAKRLSTKRVDKVVLTGRTEWLDGHKVNIPPEEALQCAIYQATRP